MCLQGSSAAIADPHRSAAAGFSINDGRPGFQTPPPRQHQQRLDPSYTTAAIQGLLSMPARSPRFLYSPRHQQQQQQQQPRQQQDMLPGGSLPTTFQFGSTSSLTQPAAAAPDFNPFSEQLRAPGSPWLPPGPHPGAETLHPAEHALRHPGNVTTQARARLRLLSAGWVEFA